jgi:hypothetical protein
MNEWVSNEEVVGSLKNKSIIDFKGRNFKYCISDDFEYAVVLRKHAAWEVTNKGWRDGNYPSENNQNSRWVINFFHHNHKTQAGLWFKMFVPLKFDVVAINKVADNCEIIMTSETILVKFSSIESLMWDVMVGKAETEAEIERKFLLISR